MTAEHNTHNPLVLAHALGAKPLPHERLDAFAVAVELVAFTKSFRGLRGSYGAIDQLRRAATSVAVNVGEACGKHGADRCRYFEIARGSALESAAALSVLLALGLVNRDRFAQGRRLCERLYAMLTRLCRPNKS